MCVQAQIKVEMAVSRSLKCFSNHSDSSLAPGINAEPVQPANLPWLGVVLLPDLSLVEASVVSRLWDYELCLAAAIVLHGIREDPEADFEE